MSKPVYMVNQRNMGKGLPVNLKMRLEGATRYNTFVRLKERWHMWKTRCRGRTNRHRLREKSSNQNLSWSQSCTQNLLHTVRNWGPYGSLGDWLQFTDAFLEPVSTKPHIQTAWASLCREVRGRGGEGRGEALSSRDTVVTVNQWPLHTCQIYLHAPMKLINQPEKSHTRKWGRDTECQTEPAPDLGSGNHAHLGKTSEQQKVGRISLRTSHPLHLPIRQVWEAATPIPVEDDVSHAAVGSLLSPCPVYAQPEAGLFPSQSLGLSLWGCPHGAASATLTLDGVTYF